MSTDKGQQVTNLVNRVRALGKDLWGLNIPGITEEYLRAVQEGKILPTQNMLDYLERAVAKLERGGATH